MSLPPKLLRLAMVLAVEPRLRGLYIGNDAGAGDRSLLFPVAAAVAACRALPLRALAVPWSIDDDHLAGGLDLERTLALGTPVRRPGLIERAQGGALLLADATRREVRTLAMLRAALDASADPPLLIAGSAEDGGAPPWAGLDVWMPLRYSAAAGTGMDAGELEAALAADFASSPGEFPPERLKESVRMARERLGQVERDGRLLMALVDGSAQSGGNALDLPALRAARAHAALCGRIRIQPEDVDFARDHVAGFQGSREAPVSNSDAPLAPGDVDSGRGRFRDEAGAPLRSAPPLPPGCEPGGAEKVVPPGIAHAGLSMDPFLRQLRGPAPGGDRHGFVNWLRGRASRVRMHSRGRRLALAATLLAAAERQILAGGPAHPLRIRPSDLRHRRLLGRAGSLFLIAVDGSGSMARDRIARAKALALDLLSDAYVKRDRIAVIVFARGQSRLLVPPTSASERARNLLRNLPSGGDTPLSAAVRQVLRMTGRLGGPGRRPVQAIFLSDGRANAGSCGSRDPERVAAELEAVGARYRERGIPTVWVDTTPAHLPSARARKAARLLGALYLRQG